MDRRVSMLSKMLASASLFAAAGWSQAGYAQAADASKPAPAGTAATPAEAGSTLGDIVVTATRKSETLSKVPVSVAAYSQARLDVQNVRKVDDIARLTPALTFQRTPTVNGNISGIAIRGIQSSVGAPTTGVYIDDTPVQTRLVGNTATNSYPQIFDLDRVEVLRGPQGTLFGASSEGGAIRFITPKPTFDKYSVYARTEVSSIDGGGWNYEGGAAVGGPISDTLAFRASAWYRHDGGWVDRTGPLTAAGADTSSLKKNVNTQNAKVGKLALSWRPLPNITLTPSIYYQDQHIQDTPLFLNNISDQQNQVYRTALQSPQPVRDRFLLPAFLIDWDLGGIRIVSNTSYFDRRVSSISDLTYINAETFGSKLPYITIPGQQGTGNYLNRQKSLTQEIRVQSSGNQRFSWVVGAFYSHAKQFQFQTIADGSLNAQILARTGGVSDVLGVYKSALLPGDVFFLTDINTLDEQVSGFAQADYKITAKLKLTAGARISHTHFSTDVVRDGPLAGGRNLTNGSQSENPVTPKFGVSYQLDRDTLLYASASKGFRPGGAQAQLSPVACSADLGKLGLSQTPVTFKSDSLWSYEVGAKKRVAGIIQIEASGYVVKWKNIQQVVQLPTCGGQYIANTGSVTSQGFDVSATVTPIEGLTLGAAVGYTSATYDDVVYSVAPAILKTAGSHLPIPPLTLTLSSEYDFRVGASTRAYIRADYQHIESTPRAASTDFNYDVVTNVLPTTDNLDMRIGSRFKSIDLSLFATNVTNASKSALGRTFLASKLLYGLAPRPRTIGLTASYRY